MSTRKTRDDHREECLSYTITKHQMTEDREFPIPSLLLASPELTNLSLKSRPRTNLLHTHKKKKKLWINFRSIRMTQSKA